MDLFTHLGAVFPPPAYLAMYAAGVDIGERSVKAVTFKSHVGRCFLENYTQAELADGVVVGGDIEKPDALVEVLRSFRLRERIHFAHASLPERKAYLYQTLIPRESKDDLKTGVEFSLESHVPIAPSDVLFDYEVVRTVESGTIVSVTAYAKRVVEQYVDVFQRAGITLRSLEIESQALGRALWGKEDKNRTVMAVDFGRKTTRIAVFDHGSVGFTATVDVGGDALTSAVMKNFSISAEEAEKIKSEKGFLEGESNRQLYEALATTASVLKDEILRHLSYWNTQSDDDIPRHAVEAIVLVGGHANLKGLPEHLARFLHIPVLVGDVWKNAVSLNEHIPKMPHNTSLEFSTTVGLALRSCNCHTW
ncbi:MAG: type IV pilus assembly protein PilM [Patescibacteria group bacterium]